MAIVSPNTTNTTLIQDGQADGAITAADVRTMNNSLAGLFASVRTVSGTLVLTDFGTVVEMNSATAVNLTIPPNSSVAFDVFTMIGIRQLGNGQVTIVAGAGVTLRLPPLTAATTRGLYSTVWIHQRATNEWVFAGDQT